MVMNMGIMPNGFIKVKNEVKANSANSDAVTGVGVLGVRYSVLTAQVGHLHRGGSGFYAFVAVFSTGTVYSLLQVVIGKYTEDHRNVTFFV